MTYAEEERERKQSESVVLGQFAGLRNTVSKERLAPEEMHIARNVDIDDAAQVRRRRGQTLVSSGDFHSLWATPCGKTVYGVKDDALGIIRADYTFTSLKTPVGPHRVSYTQVGDVVYFSSPTVSGKVVDEVVSGWGAVDDAGTWLSPVINPTTSLPEVYGTYIKAPPMAAHIVYHNGRIWLAEGKTLWATHLWLYDYVDPTKTFFQFESEITALGAVTDGIYIGTECSCFYMDGPLDERRQTRICDTGVLPGSMIPVTAELVRPERNMSRMAVMFMTNDGIVSGLDSGVSYNMTETRVLLPEAVSTAAMFRKQSGLNQYIGVLDSAGTPTSTARIGDYADAEIVRAIDA